MPTRMPLFGAVVIALLGAVAIAGVALPARAATPVPLGTFVVCGRNSTGPGTAHCSTLQAAIDMATPIVGTVTIEMMPGNYCPPTFPDLRNVFWNKMAFVGLGLAAYPAGPPQSFSGSEAALTKFSWDASCGTEPSAMFAINNAGGTTGEVSLRNLAVIGSSGSPTIGIQASSEPMGLRDVIVKGFSTGISYNAANNFNLSVAASTIASNSGVGIAITGAGTMGIDQSTVAGNGTGISLSGATVNLINDTIARNGTGFAGASNGNQVVNTINAGNTAADCTGFGWESAGFNTSNLVGSSCPHAASGDVLYTGTIKALADNGGPTPSILPPTEAVHAADNGGCNSLTLGVPGIDQRENVKTGPTCDIGAIEVGHVSTVQSMESFPSPGSTTDLGFIAAGEGSGQLFSADSSGAGLVYGYHVTLSGAGFAIGFDGCSRAVLSYHAQCQVGVTATPSAAHPKITGTLVIHLSTGNFSYVLKAHGPDASALTAPSAVAIDYGAKRKLQTKLTDTTTHSALGGEHVTLQSEAAGETTFQDVVTRKTSPTGEVSVSVQPKTNTTYRWIYAGTSTNLPATSGTALVQVAQVVHAHLAATHVARNMAVHVSGKVSPAEDGKNVYLKVRSNGQWVTRDSAVVHGHSFSLHTTFGAKGAHVLRVERSATPKNAAGISDRLTVHTT